MFTNVGGNRCNSRCRLPWPPMCPLSAMEDGLHAGRSGRPWRERILDVRWAGLVCIQMPGACVRLGMAHAHPSLTLDGPPGTNQPGADQPGADPSATLLARVALGDRAAFEQLYQSTKAQLYGVVLRVVHDRAQAEDVLQEVYVNVWRGAHTYQAQRSPGTAWMVSVARYRAIDHARRVASAPSTVSSFMGGLDGDVQDALDTVASDDAGPQDQQDLAQQARALAHCMRQLTAPQRQAVALAYLDGMTHAQAATHLQQPLGTIKSWVRRGLQSLQRCMGLPSDGDASNTASGC